MLHRLQTGVVRSRQSARGIGRYVGNRWSDDALPVNCYLVERPDGLVLFDTGQSVIGARTLPHWHPFLRLARFELEPREEAGAQVRALGHELADVRTVVLSHLHTDHVGGLSAFDHADVFLSRVEWERARGLKGRLRGYTAGYWPPRLEPRLVEFEPSPEPPFHGVFDLDGAGELLMVLLPGHTPGHVGLLVSDGGRRRLLAGDLAHSAADVARAAPELDEWARGNDVQVLTAHDGAAPAVS